MTNKRKKVEIITNLGKNHNETILKQAYYQEEDFDIRTIILENITDETFFDEVAQDERTNGYDRYLAIDKCSKNIVRKIIEDPSDDIFIRRYAILHFEDDGYDWYNLFKSEENKFIKNVILSEKLITKEDNPVNDSDLVDIAINESDEEIARKILEKVADEECLLKVFEFAKCDNLKEIALKKLQNELNIVTAISRIDLSEKVRKKLLSTALEKLVSINREDVITKVLLELKDKSVIENYIEHISKVEFLEEIMTKSYSWYARALATEKFENMKS